MSFVNGLQRLENEQNAIPLSAARKRLQLLFDDGDYTELDRFSKNGENLSEVVTAYGCMNGSPVYAFSQDISVASGGVGRVQAAKIRRIYDLAAETGIPVVGIYDSNGAHLNEGVAAMAAYGELILAANRLSGVVPQISLVLGACIGSASVLASLSDVVVMAEGAEFYVVSGEILGDQSGKIGSAAAAGENGTAHVMAADEGEAISKARELMTYLPQNNLSVPVIFESGSAASDGSALAAGVSAEAVVAAVADDGSLFPLSSGSAPGVITAFARIAGAPAGIVATGGSDEDRIDSAACAKIARFVRMCDAFSVPVVTLVDTAGFVGTRETELHGDMKSIAALTHAYAEATCPKVAVITGKAFGPAYIALAGRAANADVVLAWPDAVISALEPLTAASVLYRDRLAAGETREALAEEYCKTAASPFEAAAGGYVDDVIAPSDTFQRIVSSLDMLAGKRVSTFSKKHSNFPL